VKVRSSQIIQCCLQQPLDIHSSREQAAILYTPTAGRALDLMVPAGDRPGSSERYSFAFDRVFGPSASQVKLYSPLPACIRGSGGLQ
jgi:hypothetical protein